MRGNNLSGLVPVKKRNGATVSDKGRVKERWAGHFENWLIRDRIKGKDIEENEKFVRLQM